MTNSYDIDDFIAVAKMMPNESSSWGRAPVLEINTTIHVWGEEHEGDIEKMEVVGKMKLYKVSKEHHLVMELDNISQSAYDVGIAMQKVLEPEDYEDGDDNAIFAGEPFVLEEFNLEPKYQKKRLGHLVLHTGLQASGVEGHSLFILPSKDKEHAGFEFLTRFYLQTDKDCYVVKGTDVVCAPQYNGMNSVQKMRENK